MADSDRTEADIIDSIPAALAARPTKRARPGRSAPEPILVALDADIAAVTLATPPAPEPVAIVHPTAAAPAERIQKEIAMTTDTMTAAAETAQTKGAQIFADMNDRAKNMMERAPKLVQDMSELNKGNVEALVESGRIAAKGMEAMGQHAADYARRSFEAGTAAFRQMTAVKSPTELMRVQAELARAAFDQMVAETSRTTETMLKLVGEVAQPISSRYAVVADRIKTAA
ncbi:MAG TPA: phasin family protein [Sphingomonas sp.]|uniref:phasin family protein n=1 Tax=Sphingomonas sp. TaxID=28214 RepID=UPI002EDB3949